MQYFLLRCYFASLHISIVANFRMIVVLSEWLVVQTMSHLHVWIDSWHMLRQMLSVRSLPQSSMESTLGAASLFGQTVHCSLCDWDCKSCEFVWQIISWYDYVARSGVVSRSGAQPICFSNIRQAICFFENVTIAELIRTTHHVISDDIYLWHIVEVSTSCGDVRIRAYGRLSFFSCWWFICSVRSGYDIRVCLYAYVIVRLHD